MTKPHRFLGIMGLAAGLVLVGSSVAPAQGFRIERSSPYSSYGSYGYSSGYGYSGSYGGYGLGNGFGSARIYHGPSVHYDRVYHPTTTHWTPRRGWHTHGHYDLVPHYVPGHFDRIHRDHIHLNPRFHRH